MKRFISVETNDLGQMVDDVALAAKKAGYDVPTYCYAHSCGVPGVKKVTAAYKAIVNGDVKERY